MPPRIPDNQREAILADIKARDGRSCRAIAREHDVSDATVRKIAKDHGITDAFTREQTENATRARVADMKARRTQLAEQLIEDAEKLRGRAWSEYQYYERTREDPMLVTLTLPPLGEVRNAYTSVGIVVDKHLALLKHDSDNGADSAKSLLAGLGDALTAAADQLAPDEPGPADPPPVP